MLQKSKGTRDAKSPLEIPKIMREQILNQVESQIGIEEIQLRTSKDHLRSSISDRRRMEEKRRQYLRTQGFPRNLRFLLPNLETLPRNCHWTLRIRKTK